MNSTEILPANTTDMLFQILDQVNRSEKEEIIKDWIVRYGGSNPIFEEHEDGEKISILLLVRNNTVDHWKELYLVGDSFGWDIPQLQFKHISDTRWWYIKLERPRGSRLHYMLSPNDLGTRITDETRAHRYQNFILDERNPETVNEGHMKHSVIISPGFSTEGQPSEADIEFHDIYMRKQLDGNRSAKYCIIGNSNSPEKLLIAHDGAAFIQVMKAHGIIERGVKEGRWPSMAILTLNSPFSERAKEYGGKYGYPKYFKQVIIPTVEHQIGRSFDKEDIILHGSSLGAWGMLDVATHQEVASNLILHSCPFWWPDEDHSKYIRQAPSSDQVNRIFMDVGIYETGREPLSTYDSNIKFARKLEENGVEFMARELLMGHRYHAWSWSLPAALDYVIHGVVEYGPLPGRELCHKQDD